MRRLTPYQALLGLAAAASFGPDVILSPQVVTAAQRLEAEVTGLCRDVGIVHGLHGDELAAMSADLRKLVAEQSGDKSHAVERLRRALVSAPRFTTAREVLDHAARALAVESIVDDMAASFEQLAQGAKALGDTIVLHAAEWRGMRQQVRQLDREVERNERRRRARPTHPNKTQRLARRRNRRQK